MAIEECQHQFSTQRWNCTTYANNTSVFGNVLSYSKFNNRCLKCNSNKHIFYRICAYVRNILGSREKAYVHAITSAGVAYAITKACSKGELNECSCDNKIQRKQSKKNWQWGGCSEVGVVGFDLNNT